MILKTTAFRFKCETLSLIKKNKVGQSEGLIMGYVKSSKILNVENLKYYFSTFQIFDGLTHTPSGALMYLNIPYTKLETALDLIINNSMFFQQHLTACLDI